jgi:hypothetical protein
MKKETTIKASAEERATGDSSNTKLVEGVDYYFEGNLMVFTAHYLRRRGYCCESGCRHLCTVIY